MFNFNYLRSVFRENKGKFFEKIGLYNFFI
jgi:hypothetical protein